MPVITGSTAVVQAVQPALSTLDKSVIGALLVVSWALALASVYVLVRVQNARVADQKDASLRLEGTHSRMVEAFGRFKGTLEQLERAEHMTQQVMTGMRDQLAAVTSKMDLLIMHKGRGG